MKNWKRRWFVLQYPILYYFTSSQIAPGEHDGFINLKEANIVVKKHDHNISSVTQFQIETRFRIYFLRADTEEDLEQWVRTIHKLTSSHDRHDHLSTSIPISPSSSSLRSSGNHHPSFSTPSDVSAQSDHCNSSSDQSSFIRISSDSRSALQRTGYLIKRGRTNKSWKKRYFILSYGMLSYYHSDQVLLLFLPFCLFSILYPSTLPSFPLSIFRFIFLWTGNPCAN